MRRIREDDVIAVAVDGLHKPAVGLVAGADDDAIVLALYQWGPGSFTGGQMLIRRRDVRATLWAEHMTPDEIKEGGYFLQSGETIWNMEPLGQFQDDWKIA